MAIRIKGYNFGSLKITIYPCFQKVDRLGSSLRNNVGQRCMFLSFTGSNKIYINKSNRLGINGVALRLPGTGDSYIFYVHNHPWPPSVKKGKKHISFIYHTFSNFFSVNAVVVRFLQLCIYIRRCLLNGRGSSKERRVPP